MDVDTRFYRFYEKQGIASYDCFYGRMKNDMAHFQTTFIPHVVYGNKCC